MPDNAREMRSAIEAGTLFAAVRFSREAPPHSEARIRAVIELRAYSKEHETVRERLRELLKDDDILTRILAAEALSVAGAYPEEAVPVLQMFLDYARKAGQVDHYHAWLAMCFLALIHYGTRATSAFRSVLFYIYQQDNVRLKLGAVEVIARFAKTSKASRILLRGLCNSKMPEVKERVRHIVESREFREYMGEKGWMAWLVSTKQGIPRDDIAQQCSEGQRPVE
ncbi:MAG: hypothetical protein A4E60_02597 [Syntrophorhabdus sp. PtaB.Bin047]|jgi:hypothetical protein|nr:MAG: hypothetical protein A4E60_02597 [Syntrophorhabdus sp. PtaB.Bin047]OPY76503.1 MAG: hypothetical protein A4E63_00074 [Syntrophorhabdus sp. PtaU1.Bin050]